MSMLFSSRRSMVCLGEQVSPYISKYLIYPHLLRRHRFLGPWTPVIILTHLIYITVNMFCLSYRTPSFLEAATRAGTLSLVNSFLPFAGPHLSFFADLTGLSISGYKLIHRSTGLVSFSLALFHVFGMLKSQPFLLSIPGNLFGLVVCFLYLSPLFAAKMCAGDMLALSTYCVVQSYASKALLRDFSTYPSRSCSTVHIRYVASSPYCTLFFAIVFVHYHGYVPVHVYFAVYCLLVSKWCISIWLFSSLA